MEISFNETSIENLQLYKLKFENVNLHSLLIYSSKTMQADNNRKKLYLEAMVSMHLLHGYEANKRDAYIPLSLFKQRG